jgi:tetratricopeptide (TPR) repeat protein
VNNSNHRCFGLMVAALFGAVVTASTGALAIGPDPSTDRVSPPPATDSQTNQGTAPRKKRGTVNQKTETQTNQGQTNQVAAPRKKRGTTDQKTEKGSSLEWINHFWAAHALIQKGDYEAGITALHALASDDHPDVATYLGYANRKLGRYDEAKYWYDKALAADPNHVRTWAYYGMWHLEQGNRLKAEDYLQKIELICGGTNCRSYKMLKAALDGTLVY